MSQQLSSMESRVKALVDPDEQVADTAWSWTREVAADLKSNLSWWRRVGHALNPSPLLPRRGGSQNQAAVEVAGPPATA